MCTIKAKVLCSCSACVCGGMDQRRSISGKMTGGQFLKVTIIMMVRVRVNMSCPGGDCAEDR